MHRDVYTVDDFMFERRRPGNDTSEVRGDGTMIISFGWTSDALLAGFKDTTRRDWNPAYVTNNKNAGRLVDRSYLDAWDALPRVVSKDPHKIAKIRLKVDVLPSRELPSTDFAREGFEWLERYGYTLAGRAPSTLWHDWRWNWYGDPEHGIKRTTIAEPLYLVRFNIVELTQAGRDRRDQLLQEGKEVRDLAMVA